MLLKSFERITGTGGKIFAGWAEQWRQKGPVKFYQHYRYLIEKLQAAHALHIPLSDKKTHYLTIEPTSQGSGKNHTRH